MGISNFTKVITSDTALEKLQSILAVIFLEMNRIPFMDGTSGQVFVSNGRNGPIWGKVGTGGIADGAVTTAKLADNSVTSAKIVDGTIVNADVSASAAIAGSKIVAATNSVAGALTASAQSIGGVKTFVAADNITTTYPVVIRNSANTALSSWGAYGADLSQGYTFEVGSANGITWNLDSGAPFVVDDGGTYPVASFEYDNVISLATGNTSLTTPALSIGKRGNSQETAGNYFVVFQAGGSNCGGIQSNGTNAAAFFSISDRRLKTDISELEGALDEILALRPSRFRYKGRKQSQVGFIAQELQSIFPDSVVDGAELSPKDPGKPDPDTQYLAVVGWSATDARIVAAIKDLHKLVEKKAAKLEARIEALESRR